MVNNAGAIPPGDLLSVDDARWRAAWGLKLEHLLCSGLLQAQDQDVVREQALLTLRAMQGAGNTRFQVFGAWTEEELRTLFSSVEHDWSGFYP